jgi:hypothetical protein
MYQRQNLDLFGGWAAPSIDIPVRRDMVNLAARGANIEQFMVAESRQDRVHPLAQESLQKRVPKSLKEPDRFDRAGGPG